MAANRLLKYMQLKNIGQYIEEIKEYTSANAPDPSTVPKGFQAKIDGVIKVSDGTQWTISSTVTTSMTAGEYPVVTVNSSGAVTSGRALTNADIPSGIDASKISGTISGTATTALKLSTARTISTTGDGTWSVSFDGSTNASGAFTLANSGATAGTYTKVTVDAKGRVTTGGALSVADIPSLDAAKITSGTLTVGTSGNAGTSTKLATARTISATGDGTWSVSFDGSANATGAFTLSNSGATAGTYTKVTIDAKGRVTTGANPTTLAGYNITDAAPLTSSVNTVTVGTLVSNNITVASANPAIEIGRTDGVASTPYIDFHCGATAIDFDARISSSSATGVVGGAALTVSASAGVTFTGPISTPASITSPSFLGIASSATRLNRAISSTNSSGTYASQYTKIISITFASQYGDHSVDLTMMNTGSGQQYNYISKLLLRFKQQAAFGSDPYIDCQQLTQTATDPTRYFYVIVQNTPSTIIDVYVQNNISYNSIYGFINSESTTATAANYLSNQSYVTSLPAGAIAITKDAGVAAGTYQNVTVGESGRVTAGTNLLPSYTVSTLPSGNTGARYRLSDVSGIATYNIDRYYMELSARTWASLNSLSKTGLVAGATCRLTDFNMQQMVYDGAYWRPAQGRLLIAQASWDGTTPLSSVTGAVSGVFYASGSNVKIPAGLIGPGATVVAEVGLKKTGANGTAFFGLSLSTYDGLSAQGVSATINATINNADNMDARWTGTATFATSTTQFIASTFLVGGTQGVGGYVLKNSAVNTAADMYLVPWCAAMNAADVVKLLTYRYWIEF